jgi:hypothetical protein
MPCWRDNAVASGPETTQNLTRSETSPSSSWALLRRPSSCGAYGASDPLLITERLVLPDGMNYVTVRNMRLGSSRGPRTRRDTPWPSLTIEGDYAKFVSNEITNGHKGICIRFGSSPSPAENTLLQGNRIHDCGRLLRPNRNHGIYLSAARGTRTVGKFPKCCPRRRRGIW